MAKTNWKKFMDKDYFGSWDIEDTDLILTIKEIKLEKIKNPQTQEEAEKPICYWIENDYKPLVLNSTNCKTIQKVYDSPYIEDWCNRKIALFKTNVSAFGDMVECVRIRPYVPRIENRQLICEECGSVIEAANGLDADTVAKFTKNKYGKQLCANCGAKYKGGNQ